MLILPQFDASNWGTKGTFWMDERQLIIANSMETANMLHQKGMTDKAVEALIQCIKLNPDNQEIYCELVRMFIETKRFADAVAVVGTMPDNIRNHPKGLKYAGYAHEGMGNDDQAEQVANRLLAIDQNHSAAFNLKGLLAYKTGDTGAAEDYFQKAIIADPGYGEAYVNLGVLYWKQELRETALDCFRQGFMRTPAIPDVNSFYYSVIRSLGLFGSAEADFIEASRKHPHNKNLAFLCIDVLLQLSKFDDALRKIEDALEIFGLDDNVLKSALDLRKNIGPLKAAHADAKTTLSLCMIVKNEEKYLVSCLNSVRNIVDEIIIVDTGSTDKTKAIAEIFGAKLFDLPWTGDFSTARNYSLRQATGQWILILDADEVIAPRDCQKIEGIVSRNTPGPASYSIVTRNYLNTVGGIEWNRNSGEYPEEAGAGWMTSNKVRLFTRHDNALFCNPVHELIEESLVKSMIPIINTNIVVHHYGQLDEEKNRRKGEEYYLLGKSKYESNPKHMKYIYELAVQSHLLHKHGETAVLLEKLLYLIATEPETPSFRELCRMTQGNPLPKIYTVLASSYLQLDRYDEALSTARKLMVISRKLPEYIHIYAHCEIIAGTVDNAQQELQNCLRAVPNYPPVLVLMATVLILTGEKDKAQKYLDVLDQMSINVVSQLNMYAKQLSRNNKEREAQLLLGAIG